METLASERSSVEAGQVPRREDCSLNTWLRKGQFHQSHGVEIIQNIGEWRFF
jgi:hypothetical protein